VYEAKGIFLIINYQNPLLSRCRRHNGMKTRFFASQDSIAGISKLGNRFF